MIPAEFIQAVLERTDIVAVVAQQVELKRAGANFAGLCPFHAERSPSFTVAPSKQFYHCFGCGANGNAVKFLMGAHGIGFVDAVKDLAAAAGMAVPGEVQSAQVVRRVVPPLVRPVEDPQAGERKRETAARIWAAGLPVALGTPAAEYAVDARHGVLPPPGSDLRWTEDLRLFGFSGHALIGRMSSAVDRQAGRGLHLTWFARSGSSWTRTERRYLGPKAGAVVRLWPDDAVTTGLAIGEGIETCLTVAHDYRPTWACMDAGNLAAFPVLAGIETLVIAADHDEAGLRAANTCADRWAAAGVDVRVIAPAVARTDWNDARAAA